MRFLHTSDWHLGKRLYEFSLLEDQAYFLEGLYPLLKEEKVEVLVIAGDIYDRALPPSEAVELYDTALSRIVRDLKIPVLAISGNHDSPSRLDFGSRLYESSGYYMAGQGRPAVKKITLTDRHGPVVFHLLPYLEPAAVRSFFPEAKARTFDQAYEVMLEQPANQPQPGHRHVLVAHGLFGALGEEGRELLTSESEIHVGGVDIVDGGRFRSYHYGAFGHLHAPQRAGGEHLRYSGSPLPYSVSEEHQKKSCTLVELDAAGQVKLSFLTPPRLRNVRTIRGSLEELLRRDFHTGSFEDYVFAEITDPQLVPYPMEKLRVLFPHLLGLRFVTLTQQQGSPSFSAQKVVAKQSMEELFSRFYSEVRDKELTPDQRELLQAAIAQTENPAEEESL
ncbi:exonuclease SbcCD subunit D [Oscillospiraceae bacterium MB08-C2-2]|nr:exonuclease SbcCD subunit D [Oscillospiraceae bacterium MB08-C2-2]